MLDQRVRSIMYLIIFIVGGPLATGFFTPAKAQQPPIILGIVIEGHANVDEPLIRSMTIFKP